MQIDFHARGFFYGDVAQDYARHRLGFALGRFADVIQRVKVQVEETSGSRNGVDKLCRMQVFLERVAEPIVASVEDNSIKVAIDMVAERVSRAVARRMDRVNQQRLSRSRN